MCGIAGVVGRAGQWNRDGLDRLATDMGTCLRHRGPDVGAEWTDAAAGIALAHRRLSIQDLSDAGAQPMVSACGRYVLVYNGEIYNASDARARLESRGARFRGHSDTEVLLAAIAAWGLERALSEFVGMFALAVWDCESRELSLARDRVGIKPLYWSASAGQLVFASELKALMIGLPRRPGIDREGLATYLHYGWIPAPFTIYEGVKKLEPGTILRYRSGAEPNTNAFWSLKDTLHGISADERVSGPEEARELVESTLSLAVRQRLVADVPIGSFLSGGIDSSLITALMQESSTTPINSYSIGSPTREYDEARHARDVASHLGTRHTELMVDEAECLAVVPELMAIYDEPFGDSSQVPTLVLSKLARQHVTVALSGDGGDELFAGYNRHMWYGRLGPLLRRMPPAARRFGSHAVSMVSPSALDHLGKLVSRQAGVGRRAHKLAAMVGADGPEGAQLAVLAQWRGLVEPGSMPELGAYATAAALDQFTEVERMQAVDILTYLPDDILTKVDRASMAHSLEVRVPFLDHRVIRAAFRVAPGLKLKGDTTKAVLREMLYDRVPRTLVDRPKMGFAIPIETWMRRELRDWAGSLIVDTKWSADLGMDGATIRKAWERHQRGDSDRTDALWSMLMLADWWRGERNRVHDLSRSATAVGA